MEKVSRTRGKWRSVALFLIGFLVVVADQLSKVWIRTNLSQGQSLFDAGFFRITRVHNTGAAFGLFQDQSFALTIFALAGITALFVFIFVVYRYYPSLDSVLSRIALGLILGGTIGNLIDRFRFGYVTDFIDFSFWPTFNVADSVVTIGVIIFAYSLLDIFQAEKHRDGQSV